MALNHSSLVFRFSAFLVAATFVAPAVASVLTAVADAAGSLGHRNRPKMVAAYSERPGPVFLGAKPGRDLGRSAWFTPKLRRDLAQVQSEEALEQAMLRGEVTVGIDSLVAPLLLVQQNGGSGGDIPGGEGEGPGGGPGMGGSNGMGGQTNTHTGNKLTTKHLVGWKGIGDSSVDFTLFHGSIGSYNGTMGKGWAHTYETTISYTLGSSAMLRLPDGLTVPYAQSGSNFTPPPGWNHELVRNSNGTWTLTFKNQSKMLFSADGLLTSVKDKNGNTTTIARNSSNLIQTVSTSDGRTLTLSYNTQNRVSHITDPSSRQWTFTYNGDGQLTKVTYPTINSTIPEVTFTYNANDDLLTMTDLRGKVWEWTYDGAGKMTSFETPLGQATTYAYGSTVTTITFPDSTTIVDNYSNGQLASRVDPGGFSEAFLYDSDRNITDYTDKAGKVWKFTYDTHGNRLTSKNPLNHTWTYAFNSAHSVLSKTNPQGQQTSFTYDSNQNLLTVKNGLNQTRLTMTYNGLGQVITSRDALNRTTTYEYNAQGDQNKITDPAGVVATEGFDILGRTAWTRDALNQQTTYNRDSWGRVTQVVQPGGASSLVTYNLHNQVLTETDQEGRQSSLSYNDNGDVVTSTNGRGDTETYVLNSMRRLFQVINGRGMTRTYAYSTRGLLSSLTLPDGSVEQWTYNARGDIASYVNPLNETVQYGYDDASRNTLVNYPSGVDTTFAYDPSDRRTQMVDGTGTTTWAYDAAGQLSQLIQPQGTLTYSYNAAGQRTQLSGAGQSQSWQHDATTGRILNHTNNFNETTTYQYDSLGRVSRRTLHSGQYEQFSYDNRNRLTGITVRNSSNVILREQSYGFDASSKVIRHTVDGVDTQFTYDGAGQLLSETRPGYAGSYTYDGNGNRLTRTVNGVQEVYAYDDGDKLLDVRIAGVPVKSFTYDAAGRTRFVNTSAGTTTLSYDFESRVTSITGPGISQTNTYNGLDTRVGSTTNSVSRIFLRDGAYVTDAVLSDGAAVYTPGVSERRGSTTTYLHSGMKSADSQTSTSQTLGATRQYDAFGNVIGSTGSWSGPFGYAGGFGYQEDQTGLRLLGHRYYDPSTGRFLTRDPIKDGRNWYAYGAGQAAPTGIADPTGLAFETAWDVFCVGVSAYHYIKDPTPDNGAGLIIDVIAAILPGAAAGSGAARHIGWLDEVQEVAKVGLKKVPNPGGRRGGQAHRDKVAEVEAMMKAQGYEHKSGGTLPERGVTCGERKRFADLVFVASDGTTLAIQVGKNGKGGSAVTREANALLDLASAYDKVKFIPYN